MVDDIAYTYTSSNYNASHFNESQTEAVQIIKLMTNSNMKIAFCIIGTLGFFWNLIVAGVLIGGRKSNSVNQSQTSSIFHVLCQTCVDTVVAVLLLLTTLVEDDKGFVFHSGNFFHQLLCRLWFSKILLWSALTCSVFSVLTLNFERYLSVVHPVFHKTVYNQKRIYSRLLIVVLFVVGTSYKCSYAIISSVILNDGTCSVYANYPSKIYRTFVSFFTLVFEYLMPLILMVCFYVRMAQIMHRKILTNKIHAAKIEGIQADNPTIEDPKASNRRQIFQISPEDHSVMLNVPGNGKTSQAVESRTQLQNSNDFVRARNSILKTSILLSLSFVICWTPNEFYYLLIQFGLSLDGFLEFYQFSVLMVFINCCINPAIYCLKYRQFQKNVKHLFGRLFVRRKLKN